MYDQYSTERQHGAGGGAAVEPPVCNTGVTNRGDGVSPFSNSYEEVLIRRENDCQRWVGVGWASSETATGVVPDPFQPGVTVGGAACDWLRITTWNRDAFKWACAFIGARLVKFGGKFSQVNQYRGYRGDGWFVGIGTQVKEGIESEHYYVELTNAVAHQFLTAALADETAREYLSEFNCPRIDVQYTHPEPIPDIDLGEEARRIRAAEWDKQWRRPAIDVVDKEDKMSTLYLGKRTSARYQRIYVKPVGTMVLPRWESEFKEKLAALAWERLQEKGIGVLRSILCAELNRAPLIDALTALYVALECEEERLTFRKESTDDVRRMRWLIEVGLGVARNTAPGMTDDSEEAAYLRGEFARFLEALEEQRARIEIDLIERRWQERAQLE